MWFVTEIALPAKICHVNAYTQTKLSFNWGWMCGVLQTWLSLATFSFCCFAEATPSAFMDISPIQCEHKHMKADFKPTRFPVSRRC